MLAAQTRSLVAGNALIGGATAAVRAGAADRSVAKAFLIGALGGAVHGSGKMLGPRIGAGAVALGALGTSIVGNAAEGLGAVDRIVLPIGPARLRITTREARRSFVALNAYESVMLARRWLDPATRIDWAWSAQSATVVFRTANALRAPDGRRAAGRAAGSVIVVSDAARNPDRTFVHERVHAQQGWFTDEVWGRPIESTLRRHRALRWVPRWLEIGGLPQALLSLERRTIGPDGPVRSWHEGEAEAVEATTRR